MRNTLFLLAIVALAACGGGGTDPEPDVPADAAPEIALDAPPPRDPTIVYLNFEGASMVMTDPSVDPIVGDAKINAWPYLVGDVMVAPYRENDPDRDAQIASIVANLHTFLAPWRVTLVTERPASGEYSMMVFGATGEIAGYGPSTLGTAELDCDNAYPHDVGFIFEASDTPIVATNSALFAIISAVGIWPTDVTDNCACAGGGCTTSDTEVCTLSTAATTIPYLCSTGEPQDQLQTMDELVGRAD